MTGAETARRRVLLAAKGRVVVLLVGWLVDEEALQSRPPATVMLSAPQIIKLYSKRWTIEPSFEIRICVLA